MFKDSLPSYQLPQPNDLSVPPKHEVEQIVSLIAHKGREILFYFLFLLIIEMYLIRFYSSGIRNSFCDRDQGVKSMK